MLLENNIHIKSAKVPAPVSNDDILSKLIKFAIDNNLQKQMDKVNTVIDTLKYNHDISVREHLGFDNAATKQLKFHTNKYGQKMIGELNSDNKLHGKGIYFYSGGEIGIGYYNNGVGAPGNYLTIYSDGEFKVGECYLKDGEKCVRGTRYLTDGFCKKFDL